MKRPTIVDIPRSHSVSGEMNAFTRSAVALLLELKMFFPFRVIVFLARDMEYYYDISQLITGTTYFGNLRTALLNVSRSSIKCPLFLDYCRENLAVDQRFVLVDSGFRGNVINSIRDALPEYDIRSFLLCSDVPEIPQSFAAQTALGIPLECTPYRRKKAIESIIEQLPHFHGKATGYRRVNDRVVCVNHARSELSCWRNASLHWMAGLKGSILDSRMQQWAYELFHYWSNLVKALAVDVQEPLCVELNVDDLLGAYPDPSDPQFRFGVQAFTMELAVRQRRLQICLTIIGSQRSEQIWSKLSLVPIVQTSSMRATTVPGIEWPKGAPGYIHRLRESPQKEFDSWIKEIDDLTLKSDISLDAIWPRLMDILRNSEGRSFLRDLLTIHISRQSDLCFRDDVIGRVWSLLAACCKDGLVETDH